MHIIKNHLDKNILKIIPSINFFMELYKYNHYYMFKYEQ